ncbi:Cell death abnormality protein 8 [Caenorhabditis elegans]|uniref:Cell death abnormality protein 8 n=1 Tax=Caenorhabditis elegans TaxID=6239 RepID=CED8_CAEEL|nr:Cell death abnormality protein 8 [Caenorhabditis elegans]O17386.2 RecName: Full=Cell death abnormality protein 8 [Caenorhabditis elegans]CCD69028.1 Cell death abnormality protein 8 [Caenorhabditis elegans]|eukprot:NP_509427.2 Cell death abnormality protein 8 [Caenorhabditis elegans]
MFLKKHKSKLLLVPRDEEQEDAGIVAVLTDRIPSVLLVRWFDLFCFGFAMCSYALDFFSDIGIAIFHFWAGRYLSGSLVLAFALLPSVIINIISMVWMLDDEMHWKRRAHPRRTGTFELNQKRFIPLSKMIVLCICQMGPLFWYYKALYYGWMFRKSSNENTDGEKRKCFSKMVEAERDATLLRFFEAFLESAPQLIIQGSIAASYFQNYYQTGTYPYWLYFQAASLLLSIISISWSVVVQNRSLRMIRDDKVNIWPHEAVLQFCWRFLTILARIITLVALVLIFGINVVPLISVHLLVTLVHVIFLQAIHIDACTHIEKLLLLINTFIHIFIPFNMVEGNTRWRYLTAYSVEFIEMMLVCWLLPLSLNTFPYIEKVQVGVPISFIAGIAIMMMYYQFFHPNRRQLIVTQSQEDLSLNVQKSVETLTPKLESSLEISGEQNTSQDLVSELLLDVEHEN